VVQFEKRSVSGHRLQACRELGDSITRMAQLFDTPRAQELKPVLVKVISARLKRLGKL
jgi:hypothetical protein